MPYKEMIFGNRDTFAIRYLQTNNSDFAFCHLILGGKIIGDENEECYFGSWKTQLKELKYQLETKILFNEEFLNRSDKEIFEMIHKSNQLEDEYNLKYYYLPALSNSIWKNCVISLDETTDSYSIVVIEIENKLRFIWEDKREPCSKEDKRKLQSLDVEKNIVMNTIRDFLKSF